MDRRTALRTATQALRANRPRAALDALWRRIELTQITQQELLEYLQLMFEAYRSLRLTRAAATIALYRGDIVLARQLSRDEPRDLARCALAEGNAREAARHFDAAGWLGHAAIQLEEAGDHRGARVLWSRLAEKPVLRADPYTAGLVHYNLGRACQRLSDARGAQKANVTAIHMLEAAADAFESAGLRERAFDCYQVIMALGREGSFENLAEGYLNCIRVLREDNLKYYVLQYYEDFQKLAMGRDELHAAATLYREAADYARRQNLPFSRFYLEQAGNVHLQVGRKAMKDGASAQFAENAFAAAVDVFNELGLFDRVRDTYGELSRLPLSERRQARYQRLHHRLQGFSDQAGPAGPPDYLRTETAYPEIWRLDVVEWEQGGDAAETMAALYVDEKWPQYTRRRALLCRLAHLEAGSDPSEQALSRVAMALGRVELYPALAPLERLYKSPSATIRGAVMRAIRQLFFKRSFTLIIDGLADENREVRSEAIRAVETLHFGHALDPLARIYRSATSARIRHAALQSIGRIATITAVELLIDVLSHGDAAERELASNLLVNSDLADASALIRHAAEEEAGSVKERLVAVARRRPR